MTALRTYAVLRTLTKIRDFPLRTLTKLRDFPLRILTELRRLTNYVV